MVAGVQTARILERRYKIMEMRKDGIRIDVIAATLKCCINTVREDIQEVLGQTATKLFETVEEARNLELERYDSLLRRYQPLAEAGNLAAAGLVIQISRERRKLLALDQPEVKNIDETAIRVYVGVDMDAV